FGNNSGLNSEQQGQYESLRSLKDESAKLSVDYAMAAESGDKEVMEEIEARRMGISSEIGQLTDSIKESDPEHYGKIEEINEVENDFTQRNSFSEAAAIGTSYGGAVAASAKTIMANSSTIESLVSEIDKKEKEISSYDSTIENENAPVASSSYDFEGISE